MQKSFAIHRLGAAVCLVASLALSTPARAQLELETDPLAFAFKGYSAHVAYVMGQYRINVGAFGADIPEAFHGNDGWTARVRGVGVKFDMLQQSQRGAFAGIEGSYGRARYTLTSADQSKSSAGMTAGGRVGYRLFIGQSAFYLAPWVGVGYNFNARGVEVAGQTFDESRLVVFPTVHVGWRPGGR